MGALPTQAQVDAGMEEAGYGKPAYEWNRRSITDSTGKPVILVEVYEAPVPVAAPVDMTDTRTPPFTRRDLIAGALAGVGGGLAMGLLAMLVALFDRSGAMSVWAVSYTHLRAHETVLDLVCRLLLEKKTLKRIRRHNGRYRHSKISRS